MDRRLHEYSSHRSGRFRLGRERAFCGAVVRSNDLHPVKPVDPTIYADGVLGISRRSIS